MVPNKCRKNIVCLLKININLGQIQVKLNPDNIDYDT